MTIHAVDYLNIAYKNSWWYLLLPETEQKQVDEYTEKWPNRYMRPHCPYDSFLWEQTIEGWRYWNGKSDEMYQNAHESGTISKSMGVNQTEYFNEGTPFKSMYMGAALPSRGFEYNGYWVLVDSNMPIEMFEELKERVK